MILALLAMILSPSLPPTQPDAGHLLRQLERLAPAARVLYVAAHPDDENTRLLAWLVQIKKVRAAYLSITRGDGGQNLIGPEIGPALGLIRTNELLAARRLDGAEQLFTRARDFGYSKHPEEALRFWGHERILEDVVYAIRTFRPDVVVTRFNPEPEETHGHHTASAQLAVEAFAKAGDASFAPEQLKNGVTAWKPKRVVWNAGWFMSKPPADLHEFTTEETNPYDPLLGLSMGELAGDSRTMHKSQGFGASRNILPTTEYFKPLAGEPMEGGLLSGIAAREPHPALAKAIAAFKPEAPERAIPALLELLSATPEAERQPIEEAIVACAGLSLEAIAQTAAVAPGGQLDIAGGALLRQPAQLALESVRLGGQTLAGPGALTAGKPWELKAQLKELPPPLASDPAWLLHPPDEGFYPVDKLEDRLKPEPLPPLFADFALRLGDTSITIRRPIVFRWVDPVQGQRTRAVELAPPATIDATAPLLLFPDQSPRLLRVRVRASAGPVAGKAMALPPAGFSVEPKSLPFKLDAAGSEAELQFELTPSASAQQGELKLAVEVAGKQWERGRRSIDYAHLPPQVWHPESRVRLVRFELKRGGTRVGYVAGAGDEVPQVLAQAGYSVTPLDEAALRERDLSAFDAIVLGVRAFNVHPWLFSVKPRLVAYAEAGGVVVVQYNVKNWNAKLPEAVGPWPLEISRERVTDETAEVSFALPQHPALHLPNQLGPRDFGGWVQERGLYFGDKWDERYEAPLSMHDPGEAPRKGSLLIGRIGKGRFIYTGLAFFRQLPAGVPGAIRLFANLLAKDGDAR